MTQKEKVLRHLRRGETLTPAEALIVYKVPRLAARIHELKQAGHFISTQMKTDGEGQHYASYRLVNL